MCITADGFLVNNTQISAGMFIRDFLPLRTKLMLTAASRRFIKESIAPAFLEAVKERFAVSSSALGSGPMALTTGQGPMADKQQFDHVMNYIDLGEKGGAPCIGGTRSGDKGLFIHPTIFVNPDRESKFYREEIFGPVLSIVTFKTEEEAIELANDTDMRLSGKSSLIFRRGNVG